MLKLSYIKIVTMGNKKHTQWKNKSRIWEMAGEKL